LLILIQSPFWLAPKTKPFYYSDPLITLSERPFLKTILYPIEPLSQEATTPVSSAPKGPDNPRTMWLYVQMGTYLDYYTGEHEPSLSGRLKDVLENQDWEDERTHRISAELQEEMKEIIPTKHRALFPQLMVDESFPPVFICHGTADQAINIAENEHLGSIMHARGVRVTFMRVEGVNHLWDSEDAAEERNRREMDEMAAFVFEALRK
jgi:acetyl esterase/lipase